MNYFSIFKPLCPSTYSVKKIQDCRKWYGLYCMCLACSIAQKRVASIYVWVSVLYLGIWFFFSNMDLLVYTGKRNRLSWKQYCSRHSRGSESTFKKEDLFHKKYWWWDMWLQGFLISDCCVVLLLLHIKKGADEMLMMCCTLFCKNWIFSHL